MAKVLAAQRKWTGPMPLRFVVCEEFDTLRAKLTAGEIDAFLWERFMTKPYHDRGELRLIGEVPTPWPCFMVATRKGYPCESVLRWMASVLAEASSFQHDQSGKSIAELTTSFGLSQDDATLWLSQVRYCSQIGVSTRVLHDTRNFLHKIGVIETLQLDVADYVLDNALLQNQSLPE
mmetsp:Transcript_16972/g.35220  ORF Transcript_16972/g.35220 Transcript_16972/m.35220 type:complete len:177 (-) Transcript_16972:4579-5109(-)